MTLAGSSPPLLQAEDLRIDLEGAVLLERASFVSKGRSIALVGEVTGLMSALAGIAAPKAGTLKLFGYDVAKGEHLGIVGLAPLDPSLPPKWTALEYLAWSARLAGMPKGSARRLGREALSAIDAVSLSDVHLGALGVAERRVVVLAQAIVASPKVLIASMPLANIKGPAAEYVRKAFDRATRDRAWVASMARLDPGSPEHALAAAADEVVVFGSRMLMHQGPLDEIARARATTYSLTVRAHAEELADKLAERGIELRGGPREFWVSLPEPASTDVLFEASIEAGAPIVRLVPREEC